jgi:VIT1/CCC1 family predicted Fe2+/Mn2+ transporter
MILSNPFFVREIVYGIQDSLISTTGLLVGLNKSGFKNDACVKAGLLGILVQAASMGYGAWLSEEAFIKTSQQETTASTLAQYAATITVAYVVAGLFVIAPYKMNAPRPNLCSIGTTTLGLTVLVYSIKRSVFPSIVFGAAGLLILLTSMKVGQTL